MAEFLHPSVSSRIIDNSTVFVTAQGLTLLYAAFPAERGPDNRPQLITSEGEFLFYYGAPNMRKYGQTAYNVVRWLRSGGSAICVRVLPYLEKDAADRPLQQSTYACYILEVGTKVDTVNGKQLKVRARTLGDGLGVLPAATELAVRDDASLEGVVLVQPDVAEADGFKYHPLLVLRGRDRGVKYNDLGVRIELDSSQDETYAHRLYNLSVYSSASKQEESFRVALHPEATDLSGNSQFVVNVLSNYSNLLRAVFSEDGYDAVTSYVSSDPVAARKIDVLTATERSVAVTETLHVGTTLAAGSADLSPSPEVFRRLGGGTDGTWVGPNSLESLLYKAYSGSGDFVDDETGANTYDTHFGDIWDKRVYPVDMILDANYPASVKVAISNLSKNRGDCMSILDVGFTGSPGQALKYRRDQLALNTFFSAIFVQDFVLFDEFTGGDIRVTPTLFLAEKIPAHDRDYGLHWPFVGPRRGGISGFKAVSWSPNDAYKEQLYLAKLNYVEKDTRSTNFASQTTSQLVNSALSDVSHVRTLLRIRRGVEDLASNFRMEFNTADTWSALDYEVNSYVQTWVSNRALSRGSASVYASAYDRQQRIIRIKLEMTFTDIIERVMIDLVVNR